MSLLQISALIGLLLYFAILLFAVSREKKNQNVLDYFFAGRSLPFWALSITFIASWWGAGSAIETANLGYQDGIGAFWYYGVPVLLATLFMMLGSKRIRRIGYLTQGHMITARYSSSVAKILSFMILIFMSITAATQMVGVGKFFGEYLGMSYEVAVFVGTGIVLVYSLLGGFRGVVLTDVIQFFLLLISAVLIFVIAYMKSGGWEAIAMVAEQRGKVGYMDFGAGMEKYLMYVITFGLAWCVAANIWQRISATKDDGEALKMTGMSFIVFVPLYLIVVLTGMAGLALYADLPAGGIVTAIVMDHMHPILGAVVFIGISAAIMSTMDSLINTAAMTLTLDVVNTDKMEEKSKLRLSRYATLGITIFGLIVALQIRSILELSWLAADIITTGAFVPLVMGFIWKRGNTKGAMASMIIGMLYCFYNLARMSVQKLGTDLPACWELSSAQQVIYGIGLSLVVYITVSLLSKPEYEKAEDFVMKSLKG